MNYTLTLEPFKTDYHSALIKRLYKRTCVNTRQLAIPDFLENNEQSVFDKSFSMPVSHRLKHSIELAVPLVVDLAEQALENAGVGVKDIAQFVVVTNTAIGAPGLDLALRERLRLPRDVSHTSINYMGCGAGITGLKSATNFVKALSSQHSDKISLLVCVETSSMHTAFAEDANDIVTHMLFSDGAAAVVVGFQNNDERRSAKTGPKLSIERFVAMHVPNCADGIKLSINSNGIACMLSKDLPELLSEGVRDWYQAFFVQSGLSREEIAFWAIHPGGRKIIEKAVVGLGIDQESAHSSWKTLSQFGNVLSCGVFFVLDDLLKRSAVKAGQNGVALSFSPGVTIEGVSFKSYE